MSFKVIDPTSPLTSGNINLFYLYRPPPSRNNQLTDSCFLSHFPFLLRNTLSISSIISEDLNVHLGVHTNPLVRKILSLLNRYSIYQAVTAPTHMLGNILHIVMFRPTDNIVCSITISQLILSNHYCCL